MRVVRLNDLRIDEAMLGWEAMGDDNYREDWRYGVGL